MKQLILKAKYGKDFIYNKLPRLLIKMISGELAKLENVTALNYINDNYNINKNQFIALLKSNIRISNYADNIIINFSNVKIKEKIVEDNVEILYLNTLIDFINYGNLNIKGSNSINNIISYINSHIDTLYKLSIYRGGSSIWV